VIFYNPKSGGGKAEKFHLADEARARGIEPIELKLGTDLERLVRGAVADGADALAMAGGDGSQAVVAMVAAERDLPYACIPAGTRNHFALDRGRPRRCRRRVDASSAVAKAGRPAEVSSRASRPQASIGLYAEAVQRWRNIGRQSCGPSSTLRGAGA
jgi:diacylglycerol kinase family enzyme